MVLVCAVGARNGGAPAPPAGPLAACNYPRLRAARPSGRSPVSPAAPTRPASRAAPAAQVTCVPPFWCHNGARAGPRPAATGAPKLPVAKLAATFAFVCAHRQDKSNSGWGAARLGRRHRYDLARRIRTHFRRSQNIFAPARPGPNCYLAPAAPDRLCMVAQFVPATCHDLAARHGGARLHFRRKIHQSKGPARGEGRAPGPFGAEPAGAKGAQTHQFWRLTFQLFAARATKWPAINQFGATQTRTQTNGGVSP